MCFKILITSSNIPIVAFPLIADRDFCAGNGERNVVRGRNSTYTRSGNKNNIPG